MGHGSPLKPILIKLNLIGCDDLSLLVVDAEEPSTSLWCLYFDRACKGKEKLGCCGIVICPPEGNAILLGVLLGSFE